LYQRDTVLALRERAETLQYPGCSRPRSQRDRKKLQQLNLYEDDSRKEGLRRRSGFNILPVRQRSDGRPRECLAGPNNNHRLLTLSTSRQCRQEIVFRLPDVRHPRIPPKRLRLFFSHWQGRMREFLSGVQIVPRIFRHNKNSKPQQTGGGIPTSELFHWIGKIRTNHSCRGWGPNPGPFGHLRPCARRRHVKP